MKVEIEIGKEKSVLSDVPETTWEALKPYWPPIVKALIEVFLEGDFEPYGVRKDRKNGFYAGEWYWSQSLTHPEKYLLREARRFIEKLLEKKCFVEAVREFNGSRQVDWILERDRKQLRRFVYEICFALEGFLKSLKADHSEKSRSESFVM